MFLLIIKIKSKNKNSLQNFVKLITKLCKKKFLKVTFINDLNKKNNNKKFSVLTSPNANKTAQEQFLFKTYSRQINIFAFKIEKFLLFLKKIKLFFSSYNDNFHQLNIFLSNKMVKKYTLKTLNLENLKQIKTCHSKRKSFKKIKKKQGYYSIGIYLSKTVYPIGGIVFTTHKNKTKKQKLNPLQNFVKKKF